MSYFHSEAWNQRSGPKEPRLQVSSEEDSALLRCTVKILSHVLLSLRRDASSPMPCRSLMGPQGTSLSSQMQRSCQRAKQFATLEERRGDGRQSRRGIRRVVDLAGALGPHERHAVKSSNYNQKNKIHRRIHVLVLKFFTSYLVKEVD